jgi:hypothetical protein
MSNVFSIVNFAKVLKSEIDISYKKYLKYGAVILIVFLLDIFLKWIRFNWTLVDYTPSVIMLIVIVGVLCVASPFNIYKHLFHRIKGVSYAMLPASNTEKFLSVFVHNVIIIPLFLIVFTFICLTILSLIFGFDISSLLSQLLKLINYTAYHTDPKLKFMTFFTSPVWGIISCQAIAIWGVCFFKNNKFRNTLLSCAGITIVMMIFVFLLVCFSNQTELLESFLTNIFIPTIRIFEVAFPFILWGWSYYKFTRQQI